MSVSDALRAVSLDLRTNAMRKLCFAALGYLASVAAAHYFLPLDWLLVCSGICAALSLPALLLKGKLKAKTLIFLLSAAVGFAWNWTYQQLFVVPCQDYVGTTKVTAARVVDYPEVNDAYVRLKLRLTDDSMPAALIYAYDYNDQSGELRPGDEIKAELEFLTALSLYGEDTDSYLANGIYLRAAVNNDIEITGRWHYSFLYLPKKLAAVINEHTAQCFPEDAAPFMQALLTGNKLNFFKDESLNAALQAAGLSHVIAVSGMHVAFIVSMLRMWTGRRRRTAFIGIPLIVAFAAMTGFTPSVVRASAMQIILLLAPILGRENDPLTSLSAAMLFVLIPEPTAVSGIGFQLSFASMLGLSVFAEPVKRSLMKFISGKGRLWYNPITCWAVYSIACTLGTLAFTVPILAMHMGRVSIYSALANLLCVWAISYLFMLGYAVFAVSILYMPAAVFLGRALSYPVRYVLWVAAAVARMPGSVLYVENKYTAWWIVFAYLVFALAYVFKGKGRFRPIIPTCACIVSLTFISLLNGSTVPEGMLSVTAVDVGQGQSIVVLQENSSIVIDCGGEKTVSDPGDRTAAFLADNGRSSVELLVLTHLHADHVNGVLRLMSLVDVEGIVLPENADDVGYEERIAAAAEKHGTQLHYINDDTDIRIGSLMLSVIPPLGDENANERGLIVLGDYGDFEFLVTGDAGATTEKELVNSYPMPDLELLVAGHHGSRYSSSDELLSATSPDTAFISVGYNSYGHPAEAVLERLADHSVDVYRTDLHGNITITAGKENG